MRIVKTDGILPTSHENRAVLASAGADLVEIECLTEEAMIAACADADGILVLREPVTARVIAALRNCRAIARFGIGVDMIDVDAATSAGITVTNVPDSNIEEVAAHTMAMGLALSRRLSVFDAHLRSGHWPAISLARGIRRPSRQTFGLLGLGRIGTLVAKRAAAFGFEVIAHDPHRDEAGGVRLVDRAELFACADILSLHVPLSVQTQGLLGETEISALKPGAIVLNASRGGLIDEAALARALHDGRLSGAGIDTFASEPLEPGNPLLTAPNTLLSAHVAHFSEESFAELRDKAFDEMARLLQGQAPLFPVTKTA